MSTAGRARPRVRRGRARGLAALATLGLLVAGSPLPATPAAAQEPDPAGPQAVEPLADDEAGTRVRLTVTSLTGVLGPGSPPPEQDTPDAPGADVDGDLSTSTSGGDLEVRALVENLGDAPIDALRLVVEVYPPALTRGLLRQALNGEPRGEPLHVHDPEVRGGTPLAPGELAGVEDRFDATEVSWADGPGGVHPVRIAVVRGTTVLDEVVTAVVWLAEVPRSPLLTTLVWPLDAAPWRGPDGVYVNGVDRELRTGGRLDVLLQAAATAGGPGLALAPAAHLLEDLADRSDGYVVESREGGGPVEHVAIGADAPGAQLATDRLRRIRVLAAGLPDDPIGSVYAGADLPALLQGDATLQELAATAAAEGRRRLQLQLGREVDNGTMLLEGPVSPLALDLVPSQTVVLRYAATTGGPLGPDPVVPHPVRSVRAESGRQLTALVIDPYLEEALGSHVDGAGPLLGRQRVLAESAMAYLSAPGATGRALVLAPPQGWHPSVAGAVTLLEALHDATWLEMAAPRALAARPLRGDPDVTLRPPTTGPFSERLVTALATTSRDLDAVTGALPADTTRIDDRSIPVLRDDLLRATSHLLRDADDATALALVRAVQRDVAVAFGDVQIMVGAVTLTSDTGQVPVTLQRAEGGPITIVVEVLSPGRLTWPEGRRSAPIQLEPGSSQTVTFATEARSTGTFPVTVRVTDPSLSRELATGVFSVRSTALSGPALVGIAVVVLVLLLLGGLRRRKPTPPPLSVVPAGGDPPANGRPRRRAERPVVRTGRRH